MKPFGALVAERVKDPERVMREIVARLERWSHQAGNTKVSLDEVAWFGAVMALAGVHEAPPKKVNMLKGRSGNVITVVAEDATATSDSVG